MTPVAQGFNYSALEPNTAAIAQQSAAAIKNLDRVAKQAIAEIGRHLIGVKEVVGHGSFLPWIEAEFGWSDDTARRYMRVADAFKYRNLRDLAIDTSALYILSAPSTPEPVRDEMISRAEAGERITHAIAKQAVTAAKAAPPVIEYIPKPVPKPEAEPERELRVIYPMPEEGDDEQQPEQDGIIPLDIPRVAADVTHDEVTKAWMVFHSVEHINLHLIPIPRMVLLAKDRHQEAHNFRRAAVYLYALSEAI